MRPILLTVALILILVPWSFSESSAQTISVDINAQIYGAPHLFPNLEVPLNAGLYRVTLVRGQYTAWSYTFSTTNRWYSGYRIVLEDGTGIDGGRMIGDPTADEAFDLCGGICKSMIVEIPTDQTVLFHVPDNKVSDNTGGVSLEVTAVTGPTCNAGGPYFGVAGVPVQFDGGQSFDTDGEIVAWHWDFGDGNTSSEMSPQHTYAEDGLYEISLCVTDSDGLESCCVAPQPAIPNSVVSWGAIKAHYD